MSNKINQSVAFVKIARESFTDEITQANNLTIRTISATLSLIASYYAADDYESPESICKVNSTNINEKRVRERIAKDVFSTPLLKNLSAGAQRQAYQKIKAGCWLFTKHRSELLRLFVDGIDNTEILKKSTTIVESYGSLAKIICAFQAKKSSLDKEESNKNRESEKQQLLSAGKTTKSGAVLGEKEQYQNKPTIERILIDFTTLNEDLKNIEKASIFNELLKLIDENIEVLNKVVESLKSKQKARYKSA